MKLEVGMYCYNKTNRKMGIGKIISFESNNNVNVKYKNDIELVSIGNIKASFNIIDLIEAGDYVNGLFVMTTCRFIIKDENYIKLYGSDLNWEEEDIKLVVTKESFQNVEYRIGE